MTQEPVDCRAVARRVEALLDGELDDTAADELRHHIDACEHCLEVADLVDALKRIVHRSCTGQVAPPALRARIVTQITQVSYTRIEFHEPR
ncbi:mycothiol system anti-sigma-R factor [Propioniciclava soli]|uniref:Mycothiol system anti-sigma-R factor n=1 Tax=Propioniciclava soli TaxID=2775081 RepID=A0ABZ3C622_9ACTN